MMMFALIYFLCNLSYSEEIKLKDGSVIYGDIEGEMDDYYVVRTKYGVLSVPKNDLVKKDLDLNIPDDVSLKIKIEKSTDCYMRYFYEGEKMIAQQKISFDGSIIFMEGKIKDGIYYEYDSEGNIISERTLRNAIENGPVIEFYPDGKIKARIDYRDGKINGKAVFYSNDSRPILEQTYSNGILDGFSVEYDADGNIKNKILYSNGKIADSIVKEPSKVEFSTNTKTAEFEPQTSSALNNRDDIMVRIVKIARGKKVFVNVKSKYSGSFSYDFDFNVIDITGKIPDGIISFDDSGKTFIFEFSSNWPVSLKIAEKGKEIERFIYDENGKALKPK